MKKLLATFMMIIMAVTFVSCGKSSKSEYTFKEINDDVKIKETVIVDDERIKITAKDIEFKDTNVEIILEFENPLNLEASIRASGLGINGYMLDCYVSTDIDPNSKTEDSFLIPNSQFYRYGISDIAQLEFIFFYENVLRESDTFRASLKTDIYDKYKQPENSYYKVMTDEKAVDKVGIEVLGIKKVEFEKQEGIIVKSVAYASVDEKIHLYIEAYNSNKEDVEFAVGDILIDKITIVSDAYLGQQVFAESTVVLNIELEDILLEQFKMLGIDILNVGSIEVEAIMAYESNEKEHNIGMVSCIFDENKRYDSTGEVIYYNNGIKIISKNYSEGDFGGIFGNERYTIPFLIVENNSDKTIYFDDGRDMHVTVNGQTPRYIGFASHSIKPGQSAIINIFLLNSHLEEIGITDKSQITELTIKTSILEYQNGKNVIDEIELKVNY